MMWVQFSTVAVITIVLWLISILLYTFSYIPQTSKLTVAGSIVAAFGTFVLGIFIVALWISLERPPLKTLGETRLWYSFFLPLIGLLGFWRWRNKWFVNYALLLAIVFLVVNYTHPETYSKTMMPALQSTWFIPHVIVYIFAYATLAASSAIAVRTLLFKKTEKSRYLPLADNLVYIGFAFLTLGLLFGALWAKQAWGHYWTWDPKETWAFLTWLGYLIYIHFRYYHPKKVKTPLLVLAFSFVVLLFAWFGISYLPASQNSVHIYTE